MIETRGGQIGPEMASKTPDSLIFEGVQIQWGKGEWEFNHPTLGKVVKPTFSLLNPRHWNEIVDLLNEGKVAACMMMGNYGVFKKIDLTENSADVLFEKVKQRPKDQNFVAVVHPENMIDFIDVDRLFQKPYKVEFLMSERRPKLYAAGPQHVIVPIKTKGINKALIREADQTMGCFWVPGHYGFEGLVNVAKKKIKNGLIGGGSLNIHGKPPHYDKNSLYQGMAEQENWLEEIDFIIFDDIVEAGDIGRSHTMVRYTGNNPEIIRIGSLSPEKIQEKTRYKIQVNKDVIYASSKTPYNEEFNKVAEKKMTEVLQRTHDFNLCRPMPLIPLIP
jgi:tRNA A37 threonylcarbamoyladenosine synthetase subunit TsaC/SUA5/YrdC